jgi:TPR repeat protein
MVQAGDGVAADPDAAKALLEQASAAGGDTAVNAWINLGHLYGNPDGNYYDLAVALDYYSRAAEAGSGEAHLLAAQIESADGVAAKDDRATLMHRYREAARMLGAEPVARAMYDLAPATLYSVVQGLLSEVDRPISIDGVFGKQMQAAIDRFCAAKQVQSCARGLVSFELLVALLGTTEAVHGADGRV